MTVSAPPRHYGGLVFGVVCLAVNVAGDIGALVSHNVAWGIITLLGALSSLVVVIGYWPGAGGGRD